MQTPSVATLMAAATPARAKSPWRRAYSSQHWSFPDPSRATGSEAEQLAVYRSVRDAIRARIERELLVGSSAEHEPAR